MENARVNTQDRAASELRSQFRNERRTMDVSVKQSAEGISPAITHAGQRQEVDGETAGATLAGVRMPGELHRSSRIGWSRAAVLGSDDAIVSTSSLMLGVAAASASNGTVMIAGIAGLVADAMSMAVGEYVSVSSQRDAEKADIARETAELTGQPQAELEELALIYEKRGLGKDLAMTVAKQLSAGDRLGAHMRDELGIDPAALARPMQAAWISAASFALFALVPIMALLAAPVGLRIRAVAALSLVSLAALGAFGGYLGGAPVFRASVRVTLGGGLAMAVTALIGRILGVSVG
jgi:vacuolar iron transporter family protein